MKNKCDNWEFFEPKTRDRAVAVACVLDNYLGDVHRPTENEAFSRLPRRRDDAEEYDTRNNDPYLRYGIVKESVAGKGHYVFERDVQQVMALLEDDGGYFNHEKYRNPEGHVIYGKTLYNNGKIVEAMRKQGYEWVNRYHVKEARTRIIRKNYRSRP